MVQVGTSPVKMEIKSSNFKGLNDVEEIPGQGRYRYASGKFTEYADAVSYRKKIKNIYPDAFVVAVKDNSILPLQEALNQKKKNKIAVK
jgi:N-acetylmuramoyl-L-alanine amidase